MKLSKQEKAALRAAFHEMSVQKKLEYIANYYKWPILLGLLAVGILTSALHRQLTERRPVLYLGFANVAVGDTLEERLTEGFLHFTGADAARETVYPYPDLYLSDNADTLNHEYAYASRIKLMGAVQAEKLDLVLLNGESWDMLSGNGYLLELTPAFFAGNDALYGQLQPFFVENEVVISDNSIEYQLGEAETHEVVTKSAVNAVAVNDLPLFQGAGFPEPVYLAVIGNSPRVETDLQYFAYLLTDAA